MEAAAFQKHPPLGRVLVECGLLTEEQVAEALQEQQRSGRKLGEILVSSGVVSGPAIANALAEQRGTVVKTEYGFGTGLASRRLPAAAAQPPMEAPPAGAPAQPAPQAAPKANEFDPLAELTADVASRDARIAELQAELGRRATKAEGLHARISDLEAKLAGRPEADAVAVPVALADPTPREQGDYVLVLPGEAGYRIVDRTGAAPPLGSNVAVDGCVFVAARIGASPLPGDARPCVFLT